MDLSRRVGKKTNKEEGKEGVDGKDKQIRRKQKREEEMREGEMNGRRKGD